MSLYRYQLNGSRKRSSDKKAGMSKWMKRQYHKWMRQEWRRNGADAATHGYKGWD